MPATQQDRILNIMTPLGEDYLLIEGLTAKEGLSQLFSFDLKLLHEEDSDSRTPTSVDPKAILGQQVSIELKLPNEEIRYFSGMVSTFSQGIRNQRYSFYHATVVPHVWALTQRRQSRIFQQMNVPDILKKVLTGFDVKYEIQGTFYKREYCVQYRETDWDFASRLMEEEGIYYYFVHTNGSHHMVVANTPESHLDCPKTTIEFYEEIHGEDFVSTILSLDFSNHYQSGKVEFWDHNFQLPHKHLEADKKTVFSVPGNDKLEIYEHPGDYAKRFDGINSGGGEQPAELQHVYEDNRRKASLVMQEIDAGYRTGYGTSNSALIAGHKFTLKNYPDPSVNGIYVLTSVKHAVDQSPSYFTEAPSENPYDNEFTCISFATPFRPPRTTPKPLVHGSQSAVVVGHAGEEIFTDKYGRVKVQFHWDREGKNDAASSCWVRVAQSWAGNNWGTMFIPRVNMEVVVDFLDGDPDRPIITGCVYNPAHMPPYDLPEHKTRSTLKTHSSPGGGGFNELRFEDKKGKEQIFIHAERNEDIFVKQDCMESIGHDRHLTIERDQLEEVKRDKHLTVTGDQKERIGANASLTVGSSLNEKIGQNYAMESGMTVHIKAGMTAVIEAGVQLSLKVGGNFIDINPAGVFIQGTMVMINSGGAAGSAMAANPSTPKKPLAAEAGVAGKALKDKSSAPKPPSSGIAKLLKATVKSSKKAKSSPSSVISPELAALMVEMQVLATLYAIHKQQKDAQQKKQLKKMGKQAVETAKMIIGGLEKLPFVDTLVGD